MTRSATGSYHASDRTCPGRRNDLTDDSWAGVTATIELDGNVLSDDATAGLEEFSHIEVIYVFDRVDPATVCIGARHPRGRHDWPKVGILSQRAKDRPNRLGVTVCELLEVERLHLLVAGLDAVDGTPVVDLKPYMTGFAPRGGVREPAWAVDLMTHYWHSTGQE